MTQEKYTQFLAELEEFSTTLIQVSGEERILCEYQTTESQTAGYLEDGGELMTAEEYADENYVDVEDWMSGDKLDPSKEITRDEYIICYAKGEWLVSDLIESMGDHYYNHDEVSDIISDFFYSHFTCPEMIVYDNWDDCIVETEYSGLKPTWVNMIEVRGWEVDFSFLDSRVNDLIEKYDNIIKDNQWDSYSGLPNPTWYDDTDDQTEGDEE